jgi:hypothetical protein
LQKLRRFAAFNFQDVFYKKLFSGAISTGQTVEILPHRGIQFPRTKRIVKRALTLGIQSMNKI